MGVTLVDLQTAFSRNLGRLIAYIDSFGYKFSVREVQRTKEQALIYAKEGKGIAHSQHLDSLAADIMLFDKETGKFLTDPDAYKFMGDFWKTLDPHNRWGGDFSRRDGVHVEYYEG